MSWDAYVENMKTAGAEMCGIYQQSTGAICAQSPGINLNVTEIDVLKKCLGGDNKLEINGHDCTLIRRDDSYVEGKTKKAYQDSDSKVFFHCEFTGQYIIVVGKTGASERSASGIAANIGTYLKGLGY